MESGLFLLTWNFYELKWYNSMNLSIHFCHIEMSSINWHSLSNFVGMMQNIIRFVNIGHWNCACMLLFQFFSLIIVRTSC